MSLSNFLKNYIYIPLGGNRTSAARYAFNLLIVMIIGGVWHGSSFTFFVWGFYHGILLVLNHQLRKFFAKFNLAFEGSKYLVATFKVTCTFILASLGWIVFRSHDMAQALRLFRSIFEIESQGLALGFSTKWQYIAVFCSIFIAFILPEAYKMYEIILNYEGISKRMARKALPIAGIVSGILMAVGVLLLNKPHQFLYSGF